MFKTLAYASNFLCEIKKCAHTRLDDVTITIIINHNDDLQPIHTYNVIILSMEICNTRAFFVRFSRAAAQHYKRVCSTACVVHVTRTSGRISRTSAAANHTAAAAAVGASSSRRGRDRARAPQTIPPLTRRSCC